MREIFSVNGGYEQRCTQLIANRLALWDVLAQSVRPGSMDADIQVKSSKSNDFKEFFSKQSELELVCFNGQKAAQLFNKLVNKDELGVMPTFVTMPSTSPAYASMSFAEKLDVWRSILCDSSREL